MEKFTIIEAMPDGQGCNFCKGRPKWAYPYLKSRPRFPCELLQRVSLKYLGVCRMSCPLKKKSF